MNFLAHVFLSGPEAPLLVGNFLGDFLTNKEVAKLPPRFQDGVRLHRHIDSFTDQHPLVRASAQRLRAVHGRYAPVILDVFHDYILANHWDTYTEVPLKDFTRGVYDVLLDHLPLMPDFLQQRLPLMVADDWLFRYGTDDGLRFTMSRLGRRSSAPAFFENALDSLHLHYQPLVEEFHAFFPQLANEAQTKW